MVDVDNLGVTVPSGTYMLAYMDERQKILLKLQYPLIVSSIVYDNETFINVNLSQTVIKTQVLMTI